MPFTFERLSIPDVLLIQSKKFEDSRGFFAELFKESDFAGEGVNKHIKQINFSQSSKGVIRGLHYQLNPFAQGKIIRAAAGRVFDVAVDIRKNSPTFGKWVGVILDSEQFNMIYIPEGFAHGFEVLSDTAQFEYFCTEVYSPQNERGIIYNDPAINISWNAKEPVISRKDMVYPLLKDAENNF